MESDLFTVRVQPQPAPTVTAVPYETLLASPERFFQGADIVWVMTSSVLVFIMIPAISLINAGLSNRSFAMTMFRLPMFTAAVVGLEWMFWGYSLTFTDGGLLSTWLGGEKRANALVDVVARPIYGGNGGGGPPIPELLYVLYEGMFATFTAAVVTGGVMHKVKVGRFLVFITLWSLLVYNPIARWVWHPRGWSNQLGVLDFAGGTAVHITSGMTVAAFAIFYDFELSHMGFWGYSWYMARRVIRRIGHNIETVWTFIKGCAIISLRFARILPRGDMDLSVRTFDFEEAPDAALDDQFNTNYLVLGTALLWFGWAGFNGGSALGGNLRAVSAWLSTHIAACAGGCVGIVWKWTAKLWTAYIAKENRDARGVKQRHSDLTVLVFCDGAIAGLVAITPGAGFVPVWSAAIFGAVSAVFVSVLKRESTVLLRHDKLQVFAVHAGGGLVGMCLTGVLADHVTIGLDGHSTIPHPEYSKGRRLGFQMVDVLAAIGYAFFMTLVILNFMKFSAYAVQLFVSLATGSDRPDLQDVTGYYRGQAALILDDLQPTPQQSWREGIIPQRPAEAGDPRRSGSSLTGGGGEAEGGIAE